MSDLFDTRSVRDDSEHWDRLARRVAERAAQESKAGTVDWLSRPRVGRVAAAVLLAVAVASIASFVASPAARASDELVGSLAPADGVGRALTTSESPPAIGTLLFPKGA